MAYDLSVFMITKRLITQVSLTQVILNAEISVSYQIDDFIDAETIIDKIVICSSNNHLANLTIYDLTDTDSVYTLSTPEYKRHVEAAMKRSFPTVKLNSVHLTIPYQVLIEDYPYKLGHRTINLRGEVYYQAKWSNSDHLPELRQRLVTYISKWKASDYVSDSLTIVKPMRVKNKLIDCGCAVVFDKRVQLVDDYDITIDRILQHKVEQYRASTNMVALYLFMGVFAFIWREIWDVYYIRVVKTKGLTCLNMSSVTIVSLCFAVLFCTFVLMMLCLLSHYVPYMNIIAVALAFTIAGQITGWLCVTICLF